MTIFDYDIFTFKPQKPLEIEIDSNSKETKSALTIRHEIVNNEVSELKDVLNKNDNIVDRNTKGNDYKIIINKLLEIIELKDANKDKDKDKDKDIYYDVIIEIMKEYAFNKADVKQFISEVKKKNWVIPQDYNQISEFAKEIKIKTQDNKSSNDNRLSNI